MNELNDDTDTELRMEQRSLTLAIVETMRLWSDRSYEQFLLQKKPGRLEEKWFKWFVREWRVARTVKEGKLESVCRYFDVQLRSRLARGGGASDVDRAARIIKKKDWSAGKDGKPCLPLSLVSKIGFFLKPNTLVPYDAFSRRGLKTIRRKLGVSRSKIESYSDYLNEFNAEFKLARLEIRNGLTEPWVRALAKKLKCPIEVLKSEPMQRKVFDYYLMEIGGYRTTSTTLAADLASDDADTGNLAPERVARPCAPVNG